MSTTFAQPSADIMDFRAFEAAPGISVIVLPDPPLYTHVAVSNDFIRASGMTRAEVIGKGHFDVFPKSPVDPAFTGEQNLKASFEYVIRNKMPHEIAVQRYDIPNGDGTFRQKYWKVNNAPILGDTGEVLFLVHSAVDITEEVQAKQHLEAARGIEKAYRFFMNAPVVIGFVRGSDYRIEMANEGLLQVWGRTADVIGKPLFEAIPELNGQGFKALLDGVCATGEPFYADEHPVRLNRYGREEVLYFNFVYKPYSEGVTDNSVCGIFCVAHDVTEQVLTRQKIKNIIEQANDPILILKGEDMVLEVANEALFRLWKVDTSAIGKSFLEILPEMRAQGFFELLQRVYHTGKPFQGFEIPAVFDEQNGKTRTVYFNFTYQPYRELDGTITGVLVLASDVTGQVLAKHHAEESQVALKLSNERFALVSRATQDAIWDWNITTNELLWNDAVYTLFGYNADAVENVDKWWLDHLHPEDRERVTRSVQQEIDKGSILWTDEYRFRCADGSYRVVHDRGFIQYDLHGKPIRMIGSMQDITERKQHELALQESQRRWRQLANTMPVIVWTAYGDGRVYFFNDNWYTFTGLTRERSLDLGWIQVLHPDDVERCLSAWNSAREEGRFYETEVRYRTEGGDYRWVLVRGVPIKDDKEQQTVWYGTSTDIHEQQLLTENLEHIVADRTKELKRSNAALEEFAYAASHDLKEPIRKVTFFSNRLKGQLEKKLTEEQKLLFDKMEKASQRMGSLIEDLLEYSLAARDVGERESVDLNKQLQVVLEDLEVEVEQKGANVIVGHLPLIKGNKRKMQQLFQNLVSNALKYSKPDDTPEIHILAKMVTGKEAKPDLSAEEGHRIFHLLEVRDNGIGFDPDDADRIFNVFTRLHGKAEYSGTGVGLSIVHKVVENHGGYIWAEGKPGEGASFKMLFPVD